MISLTHHADCETIGSHIFGSNGETWVFATGEEIVANRKNEMNTKNFKIFIEALEALPENITILFRLAQFVNRHSKKASNACDHSTKS
jgi:hypothetical protein